MNLPDFLIVGTARAGTTALHYYLRSHPQLFLPGLKEPCFFCFAGENINYKNGRFAFAVTNLKDYKRLFNDAKPGQVTGEISTPYLFLHKQTIKNIWEFYPGDKHPKIVIILRNPIERAYSQYLWKVRDGREKLSFDEALKQERSRIEEHWSFDYFYASRGLYADAVLDYLDNFSEVKIVLYENFKTSFDETLSGLCSFLGVDDKFHFVHREKINASATPRFSSLGRIVTVESKLKFKLLSYLPDDFRLSIKEQFNRWNSVSQKPEPMSEWAREYLHEYYKWDIVKLQKRTGIDFSKWLEK